MNLLTLDGHSYPGGQGTHLKEFPPTFVYPDGHISQVPPEVLTFPAAISQGVAVLDPRAVVSVKGIRVGSALLLEHKYPIGHLIHWVHPAIEYSPFAQLIAVPSTSGQRLPAGHSVQ